MTGKDGSAQKGMPESRLCARDMCCGCGLCCQVCPAAAVSLVGDEEGFLYPVIDREKCRRCGKCHALCPAAQPPAERKLVKTFGAFCRREELRMGGGSGGIFGALALDVLSRGGVVCGAAFDNDFNLRHVCVEHEDELPPLLGSKYLQSDLSGVYRPLSQAVREGRPVLFAGTPCQALALRQYLGDAPQLLLVSIVCQGAPSPAVFRKYLREMEELGGKVESVNFRSKSLGWMDYSLRMDFADGRVYSKPFYQDPYMRLALNRMFNRPCCEKCFAKCDDNPADIIIGDFWSVQMYIRKYKNRDRHGFSLVLTTNDKGFETIKRLKKQKLIAYTKTSMRGMITYNPAVFVSQPHDPGRAEFFAAVNDATIRELEQRLLPEVEYVSALPHSMLDLFRRHR